MSALQPRSGPANRWPLSRASAATAHPCTRGIRTSMCSTCVSRHSYVHVHQTMDWPPRRRSIRRSERSGESQEIWKSAGFDGWRFGGNVGVAEASAGQFDRRQHERLAVIIVVWNSRRSLRVAECIQGNGKRCSPGDADSAPLSRPPRQHRRSDRSRRQCRALRDRPPYEHGTALACW
jgi:hypothetical protein